jgi:thiazole/oxazole-forming peptide maturase SagC family component
MNERDENRDAISDGYRLPTGVRIFVSGKEEVRFRKGVWNFTEAVIRISDAPGGLRELLNGTVQQLRQYGVADVNSLRTSADEMHEELAQCVSLLERLREQGFLALPTSDSPVDRLDALLGGGMKGIEGRFTPGGPLLFLSDSEIAKRTAKTLSGDMALPIDFADEELLKMLSLCDLTESTDAVEHNRHMQSLTTLFQGYGGLLACYKEPRVALLRNVNRVLVGAQKPAVIGFLDGPFLSALSLNSPRTGCFECFEQRMLARLEDSAAYEQFVRSQLEPSSRDGSTQDRHAALMLLLSGAVVAEGYVLHALGMGRLSGRCINVYLPTLEIQVEDLLRVSHCPACGMFAKAAMEEMYASSTAIVQRILNRVDIKD